MVSPYSNRNLRQHMYWLISCCRRDAVSTQASPGPGRVWSVQPPLFKLTAFSLVSQMPWAPCHTAEQIHHPTINKLLEACGDDFPERGLLNDYSSQLNANVGQLGHCTQTKTASILPHFNSFKVQDNHLHLS